MAHVRVLRVRRQFSVTSARSSRAHVTPPPRHSSWACSTGCPANGALSDLRASRLAAALDGSPPSSASTHASVAGASARHAMLRGPGDTWSKRRDTCSSSGESSSSLATLPVRSHTSVRLGKAPSGTRYEYGRCVVSISSQFPSGDGATRVRSAGCPRRVDCPSSETSATCDVR
jgi:hypothetical protein